MKFLLKSVLLVFSVIILAGIICFYTGYGYVAPIMMYHHVEDSHFEHGNYVSLAKFEEHLQFLKKHKYNVISLDALVTLIKENKPVKRKTVVITFDDGYKDNYINALKLLKKYDFPAIIFVPTGSIGDPDRMNVEELKELKANGIDIGSHTIREAYLPDQTKERLYEELKGSKAVLEKVLDAKVRYLAYPSGGFTKEVKELATELGYRAACTTNRGYDKSNKDVFELNRIKFSNKDNSKVILWVKLSGYYNLFRENKNPY